MSTIRLTALAFVSQVAGAVDILLVIRVMRVRMPHRELKWEMSDNMKTITFRTSSIVLILTILASVLLGGCNKMSETIQDKTAGMNGSFEVTESDLPANWLIYTPETIPTGDYDLIIDTTEYKDGGQSLKFLVRECSGVRQLELPVGDN